MRPFGAKSEFFARLGADERARGRLARLFSFSQALSDALIRAPQRLEIVFAGPQQISRPALRKLAANCASLDELRSFRKAQFLRIGLLDSERATWRDESDFSLVTRAISDLAQVVLERALALIAPDSSGFCVILMGKGGARELNYSSDVDLIFLSENRPDAAQIGQKLLAELGAITAAGQLWRADARLRPDGSAGALVTPLEYAFSYYESYAAAWEWQALIKARVVAGDARLGRRFRKFTRAITWARRGDDDHLRAVFEMKKRSEKTADGLDARNVKSGPGGVRDAEWVVQQLQMMIGPTHPRARAKSTLGALRVLEELAALAPDEARHLREGYLWMRVVEHRLQLWNEQAIRQIPASDDERAALARRLDCAWRGQSATRWFSEEHEHHRAQIRALCERLFWRFSVAENAEIGEILPEKLRDSQNLARLNRLADGTQTRPLPAPLSRQIRASLPGAMRGLERAADPARALVAFENLCEASGNRLSLLRSLDGAPRLSEAIWTILGGSQFLAQTLVRSPELLDLAANRALLERGKTWDEARADCRDYCLSFRDQNAAMRRWRGRELLRIGLRDLVTNAPPQEITAEISHCAGACLDLALEVTRAQMRPASNSIAFSVVGVGKFGGGEMHYSSDCDVIFFAQNAGNQGENGAQRWAETLIQFCGARTSEGAGWQLDARLRPQGQSGPLVSSPDALREYVENPASSGFAVWERQAFTRARLAAGDWATGARAMAILRDAAHPEIWDEKWSGELRAIKNRVENERAKSSKTANFYDVKLGEGAISDIEWCAQWLALKWGAKFPVLRVANTRRQLVGAWESGLISESEFGILQNAYFWLRRAELRLQIAGENGVAALKRDSSDAQIWARALFPELENDAALARFDEQWQFHTRAVREVFERVRAEI